MRAVLQCLPTSEERKLLSLYSSSGKAEGLSNAELFCLDLMKVNPTASCSCLAYFPLFFLLVALYHLGAACRRIALGDRRNTLCHLQVPRIEARLDTFKLRFEALAQLHEGDAICQVSNDSCARDALFQHAARTPIMCLVHTRDQACPCLEIYLT